jgi:uncharacterized protein
MSGEACIITIIQESAACRSLLDALSRLCLPDGWIAAGAIRNAVWDRLHGREPCLTDGDIDLIWFGAESGGAEQDKALEAELAAMAPGLRWSVKNQARMHARNGDAPYADCGDAMRHWPETATAIGARWAENGQCEILAPHGVADLLGMKLRPAGRFALEKRDIFEARVAERRWLERWPKLMLCD